MAETPKRAGPNLLDTANTSETIYTAPAGAGTWAILRGIEIANETGSAVTVTLGIGTTNTDAAGKRIIKSASIAVGDVLSWTGFLVLNGGASPDLIYCLCNTNLGATVTVSLIEGP